MIKKLLQTHPNAHTDIIKHMARLADNITVPQARASILWLLGEYSHLVPKLAPDVLRKMAKIFITEVKSSVAPHKFSRTPSVIMNTGNRCRKKS